MTAKSDVKQAFYENLSSVLKVHDFSKPKSSDIFKKIDDGKIYKYQLIWPNVREGYFVCPDAGVRFEDVEAIFHETSGFEAKYQKDTSTIGASLGVIIGGTQEDCAFPIKNDADIAFAADAVAEAFKEIALPYYQRWSTLEAVDAGINEAPEKAVSHLRGMPWFRCSTGIIVAKLVRRENYNELVAFYTKVMTQNSNGFYLKRFQALVDSLKSKG